MKEVKIHPCLLEKSFVDFLLDPKSDDYIERTGINWYGYCCTNHAAPTSRIDTEAC